MSRTIVLPPPLMFFTFRLDNMREDEETFALQLVSISNIPLPTGPNVFFRETLQLTIVDGDGMITLLVR